VTNNSRDPLLSGVSEYYRTKVATFGPTPKGVDWNSGAAQRLRFEQLIKHCAVTGSLSILDYGCGYGALLDFLDARGVPVEYCGYDICPEMTQIASHAHSGRPNCRFVSESEALLPADYVLASGIFNVKMESTVQQWRKHVLATLRQMDRLARRGLAFNMLPFPPSAGHRRPDLYYADPGFYLKLCRRNFTGAVTLLDDYGLFDFTILIDTTTFHG
jgi:SAM-dependent methyltransferase